VRRDFLPILLIAAVAFGVRTYPAWNKVFVGNTVSFLETDAWYHVRLAENQVRNYPWRVTLDPYAAPGGQFVPIAPLFDTITSTIVVLVHGRDAETVQVERVAAFVPPVLGTLAVIVIWLLGRWHWDRRAGLLSAALLAVLPGHFLDRTTLGFVDHHALEALLTIATLLMFVKGTTSPSAGTGVAAGVMLGLYLLAWGSGAFLLAVFGSWLLLFVPLARTNEELAAAATTTGVAALTALVLVMAFQDPRMHRYATQILGLTGLAALALAAAVAARRAVARPRKGLVFGAIAVVSIIVMAVVVVLSPALVGSVFVDVSRLAPDPARMGVLEARPLFLYPGQWHWAQPWAFFRTGFFIGLLALVPLAIRVWRQRRAMDFLMFVYAVVMFVATIGQNRFGYYLVTACALLGGWLAVLLLDWGGVPHADNRDPKPRTAIPFAREIAVVAVAAMFAPNLAPSTLLYERDEHFPAHWRQAMAWLRDHTPAPFQLSTGQGEDYYYARYPAMSAPVPDYAVVSWWDHGYWITQAAHRVPVANPTQERAPNAGRFYSATDEAQAMEILRADRVRYVLSDWELPFRMLPDGTIMGRFQSVADWAGVDHAKYYEIFYQQDAGAWVPIWIFHEAYYRSMAFRLSALGGKEGVPANSTTVITVADRVDSAGLRFRELLNVETFVSYEAAVEAAKSKTSGHVLVVGLNPWAPAFPVPAVTTMTERYEARSLAQGANVAPMVRIFEVH
jgi:dolichyl-diphosphooligosaccharide--protein glycosyltransferase